HWFAFLILSSAAATAQLFRVQTPRDQAYHATIVFVITAAFLLPPELVALMGVVQHIPEWLKIRYRWYLQTFNICNYVLASLAVWFLAHHIMQWGAIGDRTLRVAVAGLVCCVVFVAINHIVLGLMLHFARGHTLRETGLFELEHLATDLVLAALGVATYAFWQVNPWLIPFAIAPLVLVHRSLAVPQLQAEAPVDPQTGLFNARHVPVALSERIRRAVAQRTFDVETSSEPIRVTVSIGVAGYPKAGTDANELIHQADLAVYRAKLQGRNRVLGASSEPLLVPSDRTARLIAVPEDGDHHAPIPGAPQVQPAEERRAEPRHPRPHAMHGPRFLSLDRRLSLTVGLVSTLGVGAGVVGLWL